MTTEYRKREEKRLLKESVDEEGSCNQRRGMESSEKEEKKTRQQATNEG